MASVRYTSRDRTWFTERTLRRHAGVFHLWALGVGAVISGDFFGWNFGLVEGGFGALLRFERFARQAAWVARDQGDVGIG